MESIVEKACALAKRAHADQRDKAGRPYIEHVARVAAGVGPDSSCQAAAWLHDVLEDQPQFAHELRSSFPDDVVHAVELLTRTKDVTAEQYYLRILGDRIALSVKLADLRDNADPRRLALLPPATRQHLETKYRRAFAALGAAQ